MRRDQGSHKCAVLGVYCHKSKADVKRNAKLDKTINSVRVYFCEHCRKWHYEGSR